MTINITNNEYRNMMSEIIDVLIKHKVEYKSVRTIFNDCIDCLDERTIDYSYPSPDKVYEKLKDEKD